MSSPSSSSSSPWPWQNIWEETESRLAEIKNSLFSQTSPSQRITRVGKLDAELLDHELVQLLLEPLGKALNMVDSAFKARFEPELTLIIQLTLYKFSVWNTGASYGAKLQGLKYIHTSGISRASSLPRRILLIHGALTMLVPYIHTRIRAHALSHAWPDAPSSDRRRKAWELLTRLEGTHSLLALLSFVSFLWNGRYRTLADRIVDIRLAPARKLTKRDVSYEFMNRQMVWHAFTEFLLFLLPLINTKTLGRRLARISAQLTLSSILPSSLKTLAGLSSDAKSHSGGHALKGKYWALPLDQCAICYEDATANLNLADPSGSLASLSAPSYSNSSTSAPIEQTETGDEEEPLHPINTPYITDCGHTYCYVCITGRMIRTADDASGIGAGGTQWECLRCLKGVSSTDRVEVEGGAVESEYGSGDETFDVGDGYGYGSEDMDFSDMSGSIGSYSETYLSDED